MDTLPPELDFCDFKVSRLPKLSVAPDEDVGFELVPLTVLDGLLSGAGVELPDMGNCGLARKLL